jgi:phenylacetate-CoA ligase
MMKTMDQRALIEADTARFLELSLDALLAGGLKDAEDRHLQQVLATIKGVPAYSAYLDAQGVDPGSILTLSEAKALPLMTKSAYINAYPLAARCQGGSLTLCDRVAVSSGSTGAPTFWPRSVRHEMEIAVRFEQVFRDSFRAHEKRTLAVVCFPLGNWVGGVFTSSCCWHLARKGYPLMVATPGNQPAEIFRIINALSPQFEQTVLLGYPPFVRDVIDQGLSAGIVWSEHSVKFVFAGEVFSEEWRSQLLLRTGSSAPAFDTASLYGTADGGVLGNETPYTIAARQFLAKHPDMARSLFGESRLPTLVQYDPSSRYFETVDGTLVVSGDNGVPLVRYHIADRGGLLSFDEMQAFLKEAGALSFMREVLGMGVQVRPLPLVFVFGREDFTISFYGANIYPENISVGLERPESIDQVTGKFILEAIEGVDGAPRLRITVECRPSCDGAPGLKETLQQTIEVELDRLNSEFRHYVPKERKVPEIVLKPFGAPEDFPLGVKHRYTRR